MILRQLVFGFSLALCVLSSALSARAQSSPTPPAPQPVTAPAPINPLTGPSFPCPQPEDPLAQLVCSTPTLALLDMQFVQTYKALYQQAGALGDPTLREQDIQFDMAVRTKCGIALSQASNPSATPPPPAPAGSDQCVGPAYQQQIALWKSMLLGPAAEEANRSIQGQMALQTRLQTLGFLPPQAQIDGVFGTGTRAAIIKWQASTGRQQTGLLGNADAQALLADNPPSSPATSSAAVEQAWMAYLPDAACLAQHGFSLQTFVAQGVPPTDPIASQALAGCQQSNTTTANMPQPNNSNNDTSGTASGNSPTAPVDQNNDTQNVSSTPTSPQSSVPPSTSPNDSNNASSNSASNQGQLSGRSSDSVYDQLFYSSWYVIVSSNNDQGVTSTQCEGVTQDSTTPKKGDLWSAPIAFIYQSRQQGLGGGLWDVEGAWEINMNDGGRIVRIAFGSDTKHESQFEIFTTTLPDCQQIINNPSIFQQQSSGS